MEARCNVALSRDYSDGGIVGHHFRRNLHEPCRFSSLSTNTGPMKRGNLI